MDVAPTAESDPLARIPIFEALSSEERAGLAQLFRPRRFSRGQHIVRVGEPGKEFFIIQDGTVDISVPDEAGRSLVLASLGPGQFFGEISLLDGGPRTATARSATDSSLLELAREDFLSFIQRHPSVAIQMLTILGQRQRETNEKLRAIKNANEIIAQRISPGERALERIAKVFSSTGWVIANLVFFAIWIVGNLILLRVGRRGFDDPPTFFLLGFLISVEAILLSMIVLNSQKRQADRDRIRSDLEYDVNIKAHLEVVQLHEKVDRLETLVRERKA
jgi:CRP-like cAMP-binding protein